LVFAFVKKRIGAIKNIDQPLYLGFGLAAQALQRGKQFLGETPVG
jgi:hypothetical protein